VDGDRVGRFGRVAIAQGSIGFAVGALGGVLVLLARDLGVPPGDVDWLAAGLATAYWLVLPVLAVLAVLVVLVAVEGRR
jgi:hypothetical protein